MTATSVVLCVAKSEDAEVFAERFDGGAAACESAVTVKTSGRPECVGHYRIEGDLSISVDRKKGGTRPILGYPTKLEQADEISNIFG
jgi:hypothetical protein